MGYSKCWRESGEAFQYCMWFSVTHLDAARWTGPGMNCGSGYASQGGQPSLRGPGCLVIGSVDDGAVPVARALGVLQEYDFASLDKQILRTKLYKELPPRSYLIINDPSSNAPPLNHISFLAEGTKNATVGSTLWSWSSFLWSHLVSRVLFLSSRVQCSLYRPDSRSYLEISTLVGSTTYSMKYYK